MLYNYEDKHLPQQWKCKIDTSIDQWCAPFKARMCNEGNILNTCDKLIYVDKQKSSIPCEHLPYLNVGRSASLWTELTVL